MKISSGAAQWTRLIQQMQSPSTLSLVADVLARFTARACAYDVVVPRTRRRIGDRAFSVAAPRAWNRLPKSRSCCGRLQCCSSNKSVSSLLRRLETWHCSPLLLTAVLLCPVRRPIESIDIFCPPGPQQQTRLAWLQRSIDRTDRRDTAPLYRPCRILEPMWAVSKMQTF